MLLSARAAVLALVVVLAVGCGAPDEAADGVAEQDEPAGGDIDPEPDVDVEPDAESDAGVDEPDGAAEVPQADGMFEVHYVDVGQGNATLLHHQDITMLIDEGDWQRSDVVPYLRSVGVEQIDVVVTTHPHANHIGQFPDVLDAFDVGVDQFRKRSGVRSGSHRW